MAKAKAMKAPVRRLDISCPTCGIKNTVFKRTLFGETFVVTCDGEEGGCGLRYVVEVDVRLHLTNYAMVEVRK